MLKSIRANESQLLYLANKAREGSLGTLSGNLWKKRFDTGKWQLRYFILYQNLLFYYDCERAERPSGVAFLESSYCEPIVNLKSNREDRSGTQQGHCFSIYYQREGVRQYDLRADTEEECRLWVEAINDASFGKLLEQKQEAEQKQLHLLQILDSERRAKWQYVKQMEDLAAEVRKLKLELNEYRSDKRASPEIMNESDELKKIKKVQSFFRGWLCRRRWKQIVDEYIRSDHAELMRKRNSIVFGLVECEDEYVQQLSILVTCYLRPFRMAASSKKPIMSHEDVNSIFLNVETILFLHQFFVQGLRNKMENWPTLQLGDLFDLFLPMIGIYQEYVRNHHYSLQVLAEYKQRHEFTLMLKRLEEKPSCEGRSIESFLTYPMHQIPRYIITLSELLAHTPHDHVDKKKLEYAKSKLEQISHIMHDEVSETENIRKNLAIERMIVDGCELLLDVNQVFVRQGTLIQVVCDKPRSSRTRLGTFGGSARERKEAIRQVFLFTNHLLITARTNNGRLRLVKNYGKISLVECTLVEDTTAELFSTDDDGFNNIDGEKKSTEHNWIGARSAANTQQAHAAAQQQQPQSQQQTQPMSTLTTHTRSSTTAVPGSMEPLTAVPRFQARSDSGPASTLSTAFGLKRSGPAEHASRHMSGSILHSVSALSSIASPETQTGSGSTTTTVPGTRITTATSHMGPQHRHSTSLCAAPSETDAPVVTSRVLGLPGSVQASHSPGLVQGTEISSTISTATSPPPPPTLTTAAAAATTTAATPSPSVPLIHRFSSNFAILSSTGTPAAANSGNASNTVPNSGNFGSNVDKADYGNLDFRIIWEPKNGQPTSIWLVASTLQEKAAWCSDISQCIEQLHYGDLLNSAQSDVSSVAMPQSIRSDPRLFKDDVDIKFSHTLNSCKVPQIRHASVGRLLDRLTDARFLSIDFLNTFLLTYRVFTTGLTVIYALQNVLANPEMEGAASSVLLQCGVAQSNQNSCQSDLSIARETGTGRASESAGILRLPVLEEKFVRTEDDVSKSDERISDSEDLSFYQNRATMGQQSTELSATTASATGVSVQSIVKRRPEKLHTRPLSTSAAPSPLSPSFLRPDSGSQRMFRSETSYESTMENESGTRHSIENVQLSSQSVDHTETPQSFVTNSSVVSQPQLPTPAPAPPPPPLIPRSPVFSGLFNMRDDPPLELPILPNLVKTDKSNQVKEKLRPSTETNPLSDRSQQNLHLRLAPLASCEVIADEGEQAGQVHRIDNLQSTVDATHEDEEDSKEMSTPVSESIRKVDVASDPPVLGNVSVTHVEKVLSPMADSLESGIAYDNVRLSTVEPEGQQTSGTAVYQSWTVLSKNIPNAEDAPANDLVTESPCDSNQHLSANEPGQAGIQNNNTAILCDSAVPENGVTRKTESATSRPTSSCASITESLDLATRRIRRKEVNHKGACETLAKTAMLAALHCPTSLVRIRPNGDAVERDTEQQQKVIGLRSSPSSPIKQQNGTERTRDIKSNLSVQPSPKECSSPARSPNKFSGAKGFFTRSSHYRSSERHSDTEQKKSGSLSAKTSFGHITDQQHRLHTGPIAEAHRRPKSATIRMTHLSESRTPGEKSSRTSHTDEHISDKNIQERLMGTVKLMACTFGGTEELQRARLTSERISSESTAAERTGSLTPRSSFAQLQSNVADYARGSVVSWSGVSETPKPKRPSVFSCPDTEVMSTRTGPLPPIFGDNTTPMRTRAGAVVTSSRRSKRRSSNTAAAQAFAVATAGSASPLAAAGIMGLGPNVYRSGFRFSAGTASSAAANVGIKPVVSSSGPGLASTSSWSANGVPFSTAASSSAIPLRYTTRSCSATSNGSQSVTGPLAQTKVTTCTPIHWSQPLQSKMDQQNRRSTIMATASCLRVLNVVRHWITKFPDDFDSDPILKSEMKNLLELLVCCPHLLLNDQKAAGQLLHQMVCDQLVQNRIDLDAILTPVQIPSEKNFDTLSALDISEQLTFLDFQIFRSIRSEELLNQSWMKPDKEDKAKHVLLVCKRFNEVSRLVVSEIISRTDLNDRVMCIDKWVAIADICRCMQNYNGVLQICAALVNSSVYRLRRTWERVSKQTKQSIDRLQMLVASDGRFKSMREALHRCDPPCIPYLGMYLTDLSFIEEGALNITENNLVNFCKMRMIAHVIREIQQYHQTPYLITHRREVTDYLLDPTRLLDEEQTYQASLTIEPRQSINRQASSGVS